MNFKNTFCAVTLGLLLIGCSSSDDDKVPETPKETTTDTNTGTETDVVEEVIEMETETAAKTTYNKDIKTLINNSCATSSCHDSTNPAGGLRLTNYDEVKRSASEGNLLSQVTSNAMPRTGGPLSAANKSLLAKWKTDGFLEN